MKGKSVSLYTIAAALAVLCLLQGCSRFAGTLDVETGDIEPVYITEGGEVRIPAAVPERYRRMRIVGYRLEIQDENGAIVYADERRGAVSTGLLGSKAETVPVPSELVWDGRDDAGLFVDEGIYLISMSVTDARGNTGRSEPLRVMVDTTPPYVELSSPFSTFSPNGDGRQDTFPIHQRNAGQEQVWNGRITDASSKVVRNYRWIEYAEDLVWDGRDDAGAILPDGIYSYSVSATDLAGNTAEFVLGPIILDTRPPNAEVLIEPIPFSPDGDGTDDTVTITILADDSGSIREWTAEIADPAGNPFMGFFGRGNPAKPIVWDGRSLSGELVQSADDYPLSVRVTNELGTQTTVESKIPVDVLVRPEGDRLKIVISSIYFKPYTANYMDIDPALAQKNRGTLDRLAEILEKYGNYTIGLEGHAVRIYWDNPERGEIEEESVLMPLSERRAEAIKEALTARGIAESRMVTAGFGGSQPVVPHSDLENRWKNRRVEFILIRK